jgi:putative ABC transport system permease protein
VYAVLTQVRSAVLRHRAQSAVVLLTTMLAATVSTMSLTLAVRSLGPWDAAFASVSGPHLVFHLDAARVTPAQLEATASLPGVVAAGPVHEIAMVPLQRGSEKAVFEIVGRDNPGGAVDRLRLREGRWPERGHLLGR